LGLAIERFKILEDAERLETSLIEFHKAAWPVFDPAPYVHGWHLDAIAEHLEAVSSGQIRKLLINIPPRHSKTLLASISWPAWLWAKQKQEGNPLVGPQTKFLCLSYGDTLALDSAILMRRLVLSPWYQERWGSRVKLMGDQEAKSKFDNTAGGTRISASFDGTVTGRGGDIKIIDDPHKADEAESEVKREGVIRKYDGVLKSRMTDPKHTAEVVIMQRLNHQDLSEHLLDDGEHVHLWLPAEFESDRRCTTVLGWTDPRQDDGELLWPERFGKAELAPFKRNPYEWAGQWQQRPEVRGGAIIKREWWNPFWTDDGKIPVTPVYCVASLDAAYTEKSINDPSGFTIWSVFRDDKGHSKIICLHAARFRLGIHGPHQERLPGELEKDFLARTKPQWGLTENVAHLCKRYRVDRLLIESKGPGISVAQSIRGMFSKQGLPFGIDLVNPGTLDKVARVYAIQHLFSDNMIVIPTFGDGSLREWGQMLVDECAAFPNGSTDDLVDSTSMALKHIRDRNLAVRIDERAAEEREIMSSVRKSPEPLYLA
jgi:predicted phage terminase large subunit-like protein